MSTDIILKEYFLIAKELFNKNFLNIGLGSLSLKIKADQMLINKKNKHFSEDDFIKNVHILHENMAWEEASEDVKIHAEIYKLHSNTKAIAHIFPKNTMTFAEIHHHFLNPLDFIGKKFLNKVKIIEMGNLKEWEENKEFIISKNLNDTNIVIVKGYGVFIKTRDIREIIKLASIMENSAFILLNSR